MFAYQNQSVSRVEGVQIRACYLISLWTLKRSVLGSLSAQIRGAKLIRSRPLN